MEDTARVGEAATVGVQVTAFEPVRWRCHTRLEKRLGDYPGGVGLDLEEPYDVVDAVGNLLVYGGASALWERLIGTAVTAFNNANAQLGVGDSAAAEAATQTDLQAGSNKTFKAMDGGYPQHTDGTTIANRDIVFKASFADADANYHWQEWCVRNGSGTPRMLNRKVQDFGTKTTGTWTLTVTLTLG